MLNLLGEDVPEPTWEEQYRAYLASPAWRKRRAAAFARAGDKCERCGIPAFAARLEVHHVTYERFGAELPGDLETLCQKCHKTADATRAARMKEKRDERRAKLREYAWLDSWATKVYGEDWGEWPGYGVVVDRFTDWLDAKDAEG